MQSHIPEYLEIERTAKANGTWLKMPDGSIWTGDPRSWVQMQSKSYDAYTGKSPFKYQPFSHSSNSTFDTFDVTKFGFTDDGYFGIPGSTSVGAMPSELVVPKPTNYKSLLGNNGNFSPLNPNIYKGVIPFWGVYGVAKNE